MLPSSSRLAAVTIADEAGVIRMPVLVKGELVYPRHVPFQALSATAHSVFGRGHAAAGRGSFRFEDVHVLADSAPDGAEPGAGRARFLVFPRLDPERLIERDHSALARTLFALPFREVLAYLAELRDVLAGARTEVMEAARQVHGDGSFIDERLLSLAFDLLPSLLDPDLLAQAVDRELGIDGIPGRAYLDGWVEVDAEAQRGMTARMADRALGGTTGPGRFRPTLRAVPTRQLHIPAGNSPLVPLLSVLRGLLTKGACVVKTPAEACAVSAIFAVGMRAVDPEHPITRHTSLVYWPGGDREVEDVLFAPGAFERVVVWGSAQTVLSVRQRAPQTKTVTHNPRYGVSLIGREAFGGELREVAARAVVDSLIWDQKACTASLVHYVEGDEAQALEYCRFLQATLARWDRERPRPLPRAVLGRLRLLRRGELLAGTWFENGEPPDVRSAVVYMPHPFDVSLHPMSRLIVVRRLDRLDQVMPLLSSAVAAAGVYPAAAMCGLRDAMAAAGVSSVFPLGEGERSYPGIPHDGMRVLSELVNWASSGVHETP